MTEAKPRSPSPWLVRGLYLLFLLTLASVLWWIFLKVTDRYIVERAPSTLIYYPSALRRVALAPGQQYRHGSVAFPINRYGIRGEAPARDRDGSLRIVAVGGSSVFDHWLSDGQSWPERIGPLLTEAGFAGVESFNAGVPGYSSRETLAFYHDRVRYFEPDVVIFYQGWNDAKYMRFFEQGVDVDAFYAARDSSRYRFLTAPKPRRNFYALGEMLGMKWRSERALAENAAPLSRSAGTPPTESAGWAASPGMEYWRHNVDTLVREVLADGALPVLVAQNTLAASGLSAADQGQVRYDMVNLEHDELLELNESMVGTLCEVASEHDVPCIDLRSELNGERRYFADHVHMTPIGSQTFALALSRELAPLLEARGIDRGASSGPAALTVARWDFDSRDAPALDRGMFGLTGELQAGWVGTGCYERGCLELDGVNDVFRVASSGPLHLEDGFRIELFVNLEGERPADSAGLLVKGGAYHLALRGGRPAFYGYGLEPAVWHVGGEEVPLDGWHQLAVELGAGRLVLTLDDEIVLDREVSGSVQRSSRPLQIGAGNGPLRGRVDSVRITSLPSVTR